METEMVMGFEFEIDVADIIRRDDTCLRLLAQIQEHGVGKISRNGYLDLPQSFKEMEGEYWDCFECNRENLVVLVVHEINQVYEG